MKSREWTMRPHLDGEGGAYVYAGDDFKEEEFGGYVDVIEKSAYDLLMKIAVEALSMYANLENWHSYTVEEIDKTDMYGLTKISVLKPSKAQKDCGDIANKALAEIRKMRGDG